MKVAASLIALIVTVTGVAHSSPAIECDLLMSSAHQENSSTNIYVALVKKLALEKGAFSPESLRELVKQTPAANPLNFLSRNISSEIRFAFERAFKLLHDINWTEAQAGLSELATELEVRGHARDQSSAETAPLYVAAKVDDLTWRELIPWSHKAYFAPGRAPIFTIERGGHTFLVDLERQSIRHFYPSFNLTYYTFRLLRNGRMLIAYWVPEKGLGRVEDASTGEVLHKFNRRAFDRGDLDLYEKADGTLRLVMTPWDYKSRFVTDFGTNEHYIVDPRSTAADIETGMFTDGFGEIYALEKVDGWGKGHRFSLHSFFNNEVQQVMSSGILPPEKIAMPHVRSVAMLDGGLGFYTSNSKGVYILNPGEKNFHTIHFADASFDTAEVVEWPRGELRVIARKEIGSSEEISLVDQAGNRKMLQVAAADHSLSALIPFDLRNGKRLFVSGHFRGTAVSAVTFLDFAEGKVTTVPLPDMGLDLFEGVYERADGRIMGVFVDHKKIVKVLQLYGPISAHAVGP